VGCSGTPSTADDVTLRQSINGALAFVKAALHVGAGNETAVPNLVLLPTLGTAGDVLAALAEPLFGGEPTAGNIAIGGYDGLCDATTVLVRPGDERLARGLCKTLTGAERSAEQNKPARAFRALESYRKNLFKAAGRGAFEPTERSFLFTSSYYLNPDGFPPAAE
jgi:hypothetical protein